MANHPIARGFDAEEIIDLTLPIPTDPAVEPLQPDVVSHTADARVIFSRGPESRQPGAPAIIAYEDDRSKVAYFAFPVYILPDEAKTTLLKNTVDWFTRKPLDLPDEADYEPFVLEGDTGATPTPTSEEGVDTGTPAPEGAPTPEGTPAPEGTPTPENNGNNGSGG
jgi:hypothetical protein